MSALMLRMLYISSTRDRPHTGWGGGASTATREEGNNILDQRIISSLRFPKDNPKNDEAREKKKSSSGLLKTLDNSTLI